MTTTWMGQQLRLIQQKVRAARYRLEKPHHTTSDRHAAEAELIELETLIEQILSDIEAREVAQKGGPGS